MWYTILGGEILGWRHAKSYSRFAIVPHLRVTPPFPIIGLQLSHAFSRILFHTISRISYSLASRILFRILFPILFRIISRILYYLLSPGKGIYTTPLSSNKEVRQFNWTSSVTFPYTWYYRNSLPQYQSKLSRNLPTLNPKSPEQEPYLPPYRPVLCELIRTGRRVQVKGPRPVKIVRDSLAPQVGPGVKKPENPLRNRGTPRQALTRQGNLV